MLMPVPSFFFGISFFHLHFDPYPTDFILFQRNIREHVLYFVLRN